MQIVNNGDGLDDAALGVLVHLYRQTDPTVDELPYTEEFDRLHKAFMTQTARTPSQHDFWRMLLSARKSRRLPAKKRLA